MDRKGCATKAPIESRRALRPLRETKSKRIRWLFCGNYPIRWPVAFKKAMSNAGLATQNVGSPTPPHKPPRGKMSD
jgi:hypothetical protein